MILYEEYEKYCALIGGKTVSFKIEDDFVSRFNNVGMFLYKWSKEFQKSLDFQLETYYFSWMNTN